MIRGTIEAVSPHLVEGWIHVEGVKLRGATVLAFLDGQCVGSGTVNVFRKDLEEAGLGDGYLGFSIDMSIAEHLVPSVIVRLEGSDAALLQSGSVVTSAAAATPNLSREDQARQVARLKWALQRGRLSQSDFDYLRILSTFGVYERGLVRRALPGEKAEGESSERVIQELMESYAGGPVVVESHPVPDGAALEAFVQTLRQPDALPLIALTATTHCAVEVFEGSHVASTQEGIQASQPASYALSGTNVVVLDGRARLRLQPNDHAQAVVKAHRARLI